MKKLNRHKIDLIARAVVSGRRGYGKRADAIADLLATLMKNRLEAVGALGAGYARTNSQTEVPLPDRQSLDLLLDRTEKHLAWTALDGQ